jgi:hypothetical protein
MWLNKKQRNSWIQQFWVFVISWLNLLPFWDLVCDGKAVFGRFESEPASKDMRLWKDWTYK